MDGSVQQSLDCAVSHRIKIQASQSCSINGACGGAPAVNPRTISWFSSTPLASSSNGSAAPAANVAGCYSEGGGSSQGSSQTDASATAGNSIWIRRWLRSVDRARASQPHFVSPLVTTHVMLVQQVRYDIGWQQGASPGSRRSTIYGSSRGLEIIPTTRLELELFPRSYVTHQSNVGNGFADFSFQAKYRLCLQRKAKAIISLDCFSVLLFRPVLLQIPRAHDSVSHVSRGQRFRPVGSPKHNRGISGRQR
jgi:hypothetical protein